MKFGNTHAHIIACASKPVIIMAGSTRDEELIKQGGMVCESNWNT